MIDSDHNLIEGNSITKAAHALWALKCSNYTIVRNNYFHNELQKIGEIYDCDNAGYGSAEFPKMFSYDDTKHNIVEGNVFAFTPSSGNSSPYAGIQYAGQFGIIRNNIFYDNTGPPIGLTIYGGEAENNYSNRIYNNVFYANKLGALDISGSSSSGFRDQQIKNNIFFKNKFVQNDFRWSWYTTLDDKPVQVLTGRIDEVVFDSNNIFSTSVEEVYTIAYGSRTSSSNEVGQTLDWWESNRPFFIRNSMQADPLFVDAAQLDFRLQANSPMIDAGSFLAQAVNSGNSSALLVVDDAKWFSSGYGIAEPDSVQFENQTARAHIVSIDYTNNEITLDSALSWSTGQKVSLAYEEQRPDIGRYEYQAGLIFSDGFE